MDNEFDKWLDQLIEDFHCDELERKTDELDPSPDHLADDYLLDELDPFAFESFIRSIPSRGRPQDPEVLRFSHQLNIDVGKRLDAKPKESLSNALRHMTKRGPYAGYSPESLRRQLHRYRQSMCLTGRPSDCKPGTHPIITPDDLANAQGMPKSGRATW